MEAHPSRHPSLLPSPDLAVAAPPEPPPRRPLPDTVRVEAWVDPVIDRLGHDPRSHYVEHYWLGVIGPSTTWLLRRVAERLDHEPTGFDLHLRDTAGALGLGMKNGRHSPFMRAIDRACQFGLARRHGDEGLQVRRRLPPVTQGQLKRLPDPLQEAHAAWQRAELDRSSEQAERKARRLALTLLELGEDLDAAHRQLATWRVDDSTAQAALAWAHTRHLEAAQAAHPDPEAA